MTPNDDKFTGDADEAQAIIDANPHLVEINGKTYEVLSETESSGVEYQLQEDDDGEDD